MRTGDGEPVSRQLAAGTTAAIASFLSLVLTSLAAVGAPPSQLPEHAGLWSTLQPLMLPCLLGAPLLTLSALCAAIGSPKVSGCLTIAGLSASLLGVMIACGLEGRASVSWTIILLCVWAVPAFIALNGIRNDSIGIA